MNESTKPICTANTSTPLLSNGVIPELTALSETARSELENLAGFVGNWHSRAGTTEHPLGYYGFNVMPLPAYKGHSKSGFLLKNFNYYEQLTIGALAANPSGLGNALNRGGITSEHSEFSQNAYPLYYAQRVFIVGEAPPQASLNNTLIHAETGNWLRLAYVPTPSGADNEPAANPVPTGEKQDPRIQYSKLAAIPHGQSILAAGGGDHGTGMPEYPTARIDVEPYKTDRHIRDPNALLSEFYDSLDHRVTHWESVHVSTEKPGGAVGNIHFEEGHADVTGYNSTFYVLYLNDSSRRLQYSQTIELDLLIAKDGNPEPKKEKFLHITANSMELVG